ncbi:MAG: hypothetical protein AUH75_09800 [Gemmatimonadetes bacterium 13_1_40CM_4_65_7]|nr:MAG: hypothetical protein AUH75_09800 [Gemmatimonadetes bacterium 13_1_40CM_4_65_7]
MSISEKIGIRSLRALHLDTLSGKVLLLAVLAALVTALAMTLILSGGSQRSLGDRVGLELRAASSDAAREIDVWLDQRVFDLRLRASPYVVSDNLARASGGGRGAAQAVIRLRDYLNSVRQNLAAHDGLAISGGDGQVLTSSGSRTGFRLSQDQLNNLRTRDALVGDPFWDASLGKPALVIVVPIRRDDGLFLGALSAKINLTGLTDMLHERSANGSRDLSVITEQGRVVISAAGNSAELMRTAWPAATTRELFEHEGQTVNQTRARGRDVVAVVQRIPQLRWAVVAETPRAAVREAGVLRMRTVVLIVALLVAVGLVGFIVSVILTGPLVRLTEAAGRLSAGDLSVELPSGGGEVGYLTRAFNTLVSRLREKESHSELEKLSLTDSLTGLYNRRHLMGTLASEVQRSRRLRRSFTVLLADVDRFKQYNDTHGHLAGDAALVKIAEVFRKTTRQVDCVARYGGEEFVVMLLECTMATAAIVGERVRARVAEQELGPGSLTVSIGLAEYPEGGETPEELIATADAAMYQAKSSGRNQVVIAGVSQERKDERKPSRRKREA